MDTIDVSKQEHQKPHAIHFTVDGDPLETREAVLSARQILRLAGLDPATHYLVLIHGHEQTPYQEHPDDPIRLHDGMKFISVSTGPTPVS